MKTNPKNGKTADKSEKNMKGVEEGMSQIQKTLNGLDEVISTLNNESSKQISQSSEIVAKTQKLLGALLRQKEALMENPGNCIAALERLVDGMNAGIKLVEAHKAQVVEYQKVTKNQCERMKILQEENITDKLTGIGNLTKYLQTIHSYIDDYKKSGTKFSLAILDIDHFKRFNDTYGHEVGDAVLVKFASGLNQFLKDSCGGTAEVFRIGGEEFVVLGQIQINTIYKFIQKFRILNQRTFTATLKGTGQKFEGLSVTFSCGIAEFKDADNHCTIKTRADSLLYGVKENGRDNIMIYRN